MYDFSQEAAEEAFLFESRGQGDLKGGIFSQRPDGRYNGFAVGKSWMGAQVKMWEQGLREGTLFVHELYEDGRYPEWWLDRVLPKQYVEEYKWIKPLRDEFLKRMEGTVTEILE